jgi:hypothetical protein
VPKSAQSALLCSHRCRSRDSRECVRCCVARPPTLCWVTLGVPAALGVSRILAPSVWSITVIVFLGLILGGIVGQEPRGVSQVPVSAFLVFLVGRTTPGYGVDRITETLLGAAIAVAIVLLSPTALLTESITSGAMKGLISCSEVIRAISGAVWLPRARRRTNE